MKVLVIGLGGIGQRHMRNIRAKFGDDIEILAYRVRKDMKTVSPMLAIEEGVNVEDKYNIIAFDDLQKALEQKPNVAFICNPSSLHMPVAMQVAESGCHLFIEKPVSHNLDNVEKLQALCEEKNLVGCVGYQLRYHPCYKKLKELIKDNAIGRLLSVHSEVGEHLPSWHKYEDYRQMYAARKDQGGGVVLSQIHELDYLYDLFGLPKKVFAIGGHISSLEIDVEDTAKILLDMEFQGRRLPVSVHMDYNQRPSSRGCKIVGEEGVINMNFVTATVVIEKLNPSEIKTFDFIDFDRNQLFMEELDHFFDCVQNNGQVNCNISDGANSLRIALAIKESIEKECKVKI